MADLIYYSDNPNLGLVTVTTSSGNTEYRKNCKKIRGEYHAMGKDCFQIGNTWYREKSGLISFDHETGERFVTERKGVRQRGIVNFNPYTLGYFTPNVFKNVKVVTPSSTTLCISDELCSQAGYAESPSDGMFYNVASVDNSVFSKIRNVVDHTQKGYNIEDNAGEFAAKVEMFQHSPIKLSKDVKTYGRMLGDTSFGFEFESARGFLPDRLQFKYGVVICRDGSLKDDNGIPGPEYVTIPMQGPKGLQAVSNLSTELAKRNVIDLKCSMHVHLGNLPKDRLFLVSLYRLGYKIQAEMFRMFPYYKTDPRGVKPNHPDGADNYCQKLPTLGIYSLEGNYTKKEFDEYVNSCYYSLFTWLSGGTPPSNAWNRKSGRHPIQQKWNRASRYYWLNLMNMIFSGRNTAEFRIHTPTMNPQKVTNWLFICNALVRYAQSHYTKIFSKDEISLAEVMRYYDKFGRQGSFLADYLTAYIEERKRRFIDDYRNGDKVSSWEIEKDAQYEFRYGNVTHLF